MRRRARLVQAFVAICTVIGLHSPDARAQSAETTPSFSLATSQIYSTREQASLTLIHRQVDHLDFRVYRVNDAFAFFAKLRDLHQLGSEEPVVPQERTLLERIADWKAAWRREARSFVRRQFSHPYRAARNEQLNRQQIAQRRTTNVNTFAQVPLLNRSQLVTSWREHLPRVHDAEYRRVPLDLRAPGVYVVEAINAPLRAYTVVLISDVGLVTKTAAGEMLVFAANRFSGDPLQGCRVQVIADQKAAAAGETGADGTFTAPVSIGGNTDALVTLAECGGQVAATDPGVYGIRPESRHLVGYTYTDRPVYRPGHTVHYKSVLRWRERGALSRAGLDSAEVSIVDGNEKVLLRERKPIDEFGTLTGSFTLPGVASLGYYNIRIARGDETATGSFEVQEYRKPEFDVAVRPATAFELQGRRLRATIAARYYFGQPVAGGSVKYVVHHLPYYSPLRFDPEGEGEGFAGDYFYGGAERSQVRHG